MNDVSVRPPIRGLDRPGLTTDRLGFFLAAAVVFLSPYNVLRFPDLFFTVADGVTLLALIVLLAGRHVPMAPFRYLTPVWYAGFLGIVSGLVIGGIAHQRLIESLHVPMQYAFALVILPWVLGGRDFQEAQKLLLVWAVSIVGVMLHGIYLTQFAVDPPATLVSPSGRLSGVIERENELASIGAMALVVTLYLAAERAIPAVLAVLSVAFLLYGIVLTASNTGVMAVTLGVVSFTLLQRSWRHYLLVGVLGGAACIALLVGGQDLLPASFVRRVAGALMAGDLTQAGTFDDRMALTMEGWQVSKDHILIGLGAEGFRKLSAFRQPVHNTYVLMLAEGGILSLSGLCALLGVTVLSGAMLLFDNRSRNLGAMVVTVIAIFVLVLNAVAHIYARFWIVPIVLALSAALSDGGLHRRWRTPIRTS